MGTLAELKDATTRLLGEQPKAMNSRSMLLTKAKLLSSAGHGRKAKAKPSDATNLLLAFLCGNS